MIRPSRGVHGGVDGATVIDSRDGRPIAQMAADYLQSVRRLAEERSNGLGHVFVTGSVKTETSKLVFVRKIPGNGIAVDVFGDRGVKRGVEDRHLGKARRKEPLTDFNTQQV
jgi:hypothetical protein